MYNYAAITDIGPEYRVNDDRVLICDSILSQGECEGSVEDNHIVLAVADGVGGLQSGYEAAQMALTEIAGLNIPGVDRIGIRKTIENANTAIIARQKESGNINGLRTTLAALYIDSNTMYVANAGDSRIYRIRNNEIMQLTKDHSVVQNLIDTGEITREEAFTHPKRNIITKCLGDESRVNARIVDYSDDIMDGDLFMLCSDGISDCIRTEEINNILSDNNSASLIDLCRILLKKALDNGSTDNITVCLMRKETKDGSK